VFERYTEVARRLIFFARYEASQFGSPYIETEHLLLGLMREDRAFRRRLTEPPESFRKQIESRTNVCERTSTSVDLPLSSDSKRVLTLAAEEASALGHELIDSGHFVLALLRAKDSLAADLLHQAGIEYENYREIVRASSPSKLAESRRLEPFRSRYQVRRSRPAERPSAWHAMQEREASAPSLRPVITAFEELMDRTVERLEIYSEAYGQQRLKRKPWSRQEALGHLIDLAIAHQHWLARALNESRLDIRAYPQDDWVQALEYRNFSWPDAVDLWICLNRLLVHTLLLIPEQKVNMTCHIGIAEPIPLLKLIERYVERVEDILGQIVSLL
jgi:Clp amino terminal domain, pathogenicity island component